VLKPAPLKGVGFCACGELTRASPEIVTLPVSPPLPFILVILSGAKDLLFLPLAAQHQGIEILPHGVLLLYEGHLPHPQPTLQLLLSGYGVVDVLESLKVNQAVNLISLRKAIEIAVPVLFHSEEQFVCYADVERARFVGQDVDEVLMIPLHSRQHKRKADPSLRSG
jgi:hypothetical protein